VVNCQSQVAASFAGCILEFVVEGGQRHGSGQTQPNASRRTFFIGILLGLPGTEGFSDRLLTELLMHAFQVGQS
jgi:hypothetical protein